MESVTLVFTKIKAAWEDAKTEFYKTNTIESPLPRKIQNRRVFKAKPRIPQPRRKPLQHTPIQKTPAISRQATEVTEIQPDKLPNSKQMNEVTAPVQPALKRKRSRTDEDNDVSARMKLLEQELEAARKRLSIYEEQPERERQPSIEKKVELKVKRPQEEEETDELAEDFTLSPVKLEYSLAT